jgi:hypothetical protein
MDMTHQTERKGSPQTLVCTKTRRSFQKRCQQHAEDLGRFKTLIAIVANLPRSSKAILIECVKQCGAARDRTSGDSSSEKQVPFGRSISVITGNSYPV